MTTERAQRIPGPAARLRCACGAPWLPPLLGILFFLFADSFLSPPDCASYWAWASSLFRDADLAFLNEYQGVPRMPPFYIYLTPVDKLSNDWPMGTGLALGPVVLAGTTIAHAWVLLLVAGALALWWRSAETIFTPAARRASLLGLVLGSPLLFYAAFGPFFAHLVSFAVTTAFLVLWERTRPSVRDRPRAPGEWALLGLLLGFAMLTRPQNALLCVVFAGEAATWARNASARPSMRGLALFAGAALLGFAPQIVAWWTLYGGPFALPKVEEMNWLSPAIGRVLLSDFHGVLPWTPLYALGLAGLVVLARRDRGLAVALGLVFATQLYINAANLVWWSGGSFGNRRLLDNAIVLAWGISALIDARQGRAWRWGTIAAGAACCAWTMWLLMAERTGVVTLARYDPFWFPSFWPRMVRVFADPAATMRGLVRGQWTGDAVAMRAAGALLVAGGSLLVMSAARAFDGRHVRIAARAVAAVAGAMLALVVVAGLRTPRLDTSIFLDPMPRSSGVLWDNYIELSYYELCHSNSVASEAAARAALDIRPAHYSGWMALGRALFLQDRLPESRIAFAKVLELNPSHEYSKIAIRVIDERTRTGNKSLRLP